MNRPDRFDDARELADELPELPIPRPGEARSEHVLPPTTAAPFPVHAPIGGGASFTAASEHEPHADAPAPAQDAQDGVDSDRFTWELAAQLTAGMLANPGRVHTSVKDAMAVFDQFLHEMYAYTRIAAGFDTNGGDEAQRRRDHVEYFQGPQPATRERTTATASEPPTAAAPAPKPEPAKPRPLPGYQPLPPGARSYVPGSMAGAPPPAHEPEDDAEADAA